MHPTRKNGLLWESIGDEVVVWDKGGNRAHRLNRSAAMVWLHADGKNTVSDLASVVERELGAAESSDAVVDAALNRLNDLGLLEVAEPGNSSRRSMLRRVAVAAAIAPLVVSIAVPTPARALSGQPA